MKNLYKYLVICVLSLVSFACEQAFMSPTPKTDPEAVFNQVWNFANEKYTFFDYKKVDWDAAKTKYKARITANMDEEALFKVCNDMLYELKDEHVNLVSKFNISRNPEVFLDYPTNYDGDILTRYYFNGRQQYLDGGNFRLFDFDDVLYVNYRSFSDAVTKESMDYICKKATNKKGIVLDLRQNGGGSVANIYNIAQRFTDKKIYAGLSYAKIGPGREDLKKDSLFISPFKADTATQKFTQKPIVVLTNRGCYSATNFFAMMAKEIPNVTVVGGKTGGGGGVPATTELSNGWTLRVSTTRSFDINGNNIEGGVEPDIRIDISAADKSKNKDTILDYALKLIRTKPMAAN
jgi:Peptidase family S41/Tricorn protease C1 domain